MLRAKAPKFKPKAAPRKRPGAPPADQPTPTSTPTPALAPETPSPAVQLLPTGTQTQTQTLERTAATPATNTRPIADPSPSTTQPPSEPEPEPQVQTTPATITSTPSAQHSAIPISSRPVPSSATHTSTQPATAIPDARPHPNQTCQHPTTTEEQGGNTSAGTQSSGTPKTSRAKTGPRMRKAPATADGSGADESVATPSHRRAPHRNPDGTAAEDEENNGEGEPPRGRRQSRKQKARQDEGGQGVDESHDGEEPPRRGRRQRSETPPDAEARTVDITTVTMGDLTKDLRIGRKFSKHDELLERERERRRQQRLDRKARKVRDAVAEDDDEDDDEEGRGSQADGDGNHDEESSHANSNNNTNNNNNNTNNGDGENGGDVNNQDPQRGSSNDDEETPAPTPAVQTVQYEMVNGELVVAQSSTIVDRHAAARAGVGVEVEVEENDFTRLTNVGSFRPPNKLQKGATWSETDTELFYKYLAMFGTDFTTLSKLFPGRNRRHIKLKFNREERANPDRVTKAMVGVNKPKMDLSVFSRKFQKGLEKVEDIEARHKKAEEEYEAEQERVRKENEEIARKRREELFREDGQDGEEGQSKKKKRKTKKERAAELAAQGVITYVENEPTVETVDQVSGRSRRQGPAFGERNRL